MGIFHAVLKVNASAAETGRTEKSLNRYHLLSFGGVGSACATALGGQTSLHSPYLTMDVTLTIDKAHEMRFLRSVAFDIHHHADERIDCDVMDPALEMELQVLPFKAEELPLIHYNTNLLGQPTGGGPEATMLCRSDGCIYSQHGGNVMDGFAHLQVLVPLAPVAPAFRCRFALNPHLKQLRKSGLWRPTAADLRFRGRVNEVIHVRSAGTCGFAPAISALDSNDS